MGMTPMMPMHNNLAQRVGGFGMRPPGPVMASPVTGGGMQAPIARPVMGMPQNGQAPIQGGPPMQGAPMQIQQPGQMQLPQNSIRARMMGLPA
jgi:hypothetical protein